MANLAVIPDVSRSPSGAKSVVDNSSPSRLSGGIEREPGSEPQRNKDSTSGRYTSGIGGPSCPRVRLSGSGGRIEPRTGEKVVL
jgi:hypothetical protein